MGHLSGISERLWIILLGLIVFLTTSLLMTADFHSIDEAAMFVTAVNVADSGEFHANQIGYSLWGIRPGEEVTALGKYNDVYTKKSPLMILLMVPAVLLGRIVPFLSISRTVLWLGPLLASAIVLILHRIGRELHYSRLASTAAVLLLVAGTMMLPYAQTVFGEILAALGLLLTVWALFRLIRGGGPWAASGVGAGLGLACGTNPVYFALAVIVALLILLWFLPENSWRSVLRQLIFYVIPLLVVATFLIIFNYACFGSIWETGYRLSPNSEGFRTPLWWGALGLTISPARGLLWYSPPVILAFFSWPIFHRRQRRLSWAILIIVLFHIAVFGMWWEWWGGYGWGPRFLLPIVPMLLLVTLPGLERAEKGSWSWRAAVFVLLIAGITVQIAGVGIDPNLYERQLDADYPAQHDQPLRYHHNPSLEYDVPASSIVQHWRQIGAGAARSRLGWWRDEGLEPTSIIEEIRTRQQLGDIVVLLDLSLEDHFLEAANLPPVYGLPVNVPEDDILARALWERAQRDAKRIWLVTWYPPADPGNWYEWQLRRSWASEDEAWHGDRRVVLAARPLSSVGEVKADGLFGPIGLNSYSLAAYGDHLEIELVWSVTSKVDADYVSYVHLTDQDGLIVAQQDRQPLGGFYPTSRWQPGESVVDRFTFTLPSGVEREAVMVRLGWYGWPSLERLPAQSTTHEIMDDSLLVKTVPDEVK